MKCPDCGQEHGDEADQIAHLATAIIRLANAADNPDIALSGIMSALAKYSIMHQKLPDFQLAATAIALSVFSGIDPQVLALSAAKKVGQLL